VSWKLVVDIKVTNLERAKLFYETVLGFPVKQHEPKEGWCALIVGNAQIHLYEQGGASDNVEFAVENIEVETKRLKEKGVAFCSGMDKPQAQSFVNGGITIFPWGKSAFFKDTEGNILALIQDNPPA